MRFTAGRYIPKNSTPITGEGGVVYVYPFRSRNGGPVYGVIAYRGKSNKPDFHYTFRSDLKVDEQVDAFFDSIQRHSKLVAERREERRKPHTFVVGDIVTNSWGYDQTNVDWYRVTKTTAHFVWLKPVSSCLTQDGSVGPMSGQESLALDENLKPIDLKGEETKHAATGDNCSMRHGCGSKWTGRSMYSSWYA